MNDLILNRLYCAKNFQFNLTPMLNFIQCKYDLSFQFDTIVCHIYYVFVDMQVIRLTNFYGA